MTQDIQREALNALAQLWSLSPDVRLGQLMAHLGFLGDVHVSRGLGDIDDDELIAVMYRHKTELLARLEGGPEESPGVDRSAGSSISGSPTIPEIASSQNAMR